MILHHATLRSRLSLPVSLTAITLILLLSSFSEASAQWTTPDASQNINNTNTGNVGIGTTTPGSLLEVRKSQNTSTSVTVDNPFTTSGNSAFSSFGLKQNGVLRAHIASVNDNHSFLTAGTAQFWNFMNAPMVFGTNNAEQMRITPTGFVGIGTTAPDVKLQVNHSSANTNLANIGLPDLVLGLRNTSNTNGNMSVISFQDATGYGNVNITALQKDQTNHAADLLFFTRANTTTFGERMRIRSDGKVGVGINNPTAQLHVMTAAADGDGLRIHRNANTNLFGVAQYFVLNNSSNTATDYAQISGGISSNTAGAENGVLAFYTRNAGTLGERMRINNAGNVGIGTDTPTFRLHVQGGSINTTAGLCFNGDCKTAWSQVASQWTSGSGNISFSGGTVGIGIGSPLYSLDVNGGTNAFRTKASSTSSNDTIATFENSSAIQMIVRANGNVGIATTAPTEKLHVTGNIKVTGNIDVGGNINAKYQDMAEWVESSQQLSPATVVVLDRTKNNQVIASTKSYDSRVAGVISLKPGIRLGEQGEGHVLVATTGRVKVKVDASNGPIEIGDLLVTSDKTGVAMKSVPIDLAGAQIHRPGTLLGKALEPLAKGTGEILVLLSLQ